MDIVLPPDFKEFLNLLKARNIRYLLIGGYAVAYHGYPRSTNDMDIWIAIDPETAEQMVSTLPNCLLNSSFKRNALCAWELLPCALQY